MCWVCRKLSTGSIPGCPRKDQTFDFVIATEDQRLAVEIYDDDTTNADDLLGRAEVQPLLPSPSCWGVDFSNF